MPRAYPDEFRVRAVSLIRSGQTVKKTTSDLDVSCAILHLGVKQDKIDRGEIPGVPLAESREMRKARKRIRELENELAGCITKYVNRLRRDRAYGWN